MTTRTIRKVALAVLRDDKILLVRKRGLPALILPGGKPEPQDKGMIETLVRECVEELGTPPLLNNTSYIGDFTSPAAGESDVQVEVVLYQGELRDAPVAGGEIEEIHWVPLDEAQSYELAPSLRDQIIPLLRRSRLTGTAEMPVPVEDPYFVRPTLDEPIRRQWASAPGVQAVPRDTPHLRKIFDRAQSDEPITIHADNGEIYNPEALPKADLPNDWPYSRQRYAGDGQGRIVRVDKQVRHVDIARVEAALNHASEVTGVFQPGGKPKVAALPAVVPYGAPWVEPEALRRENPLGLVWWLLLAAVGSLALAALALPTGWLHH